MKFLLVLYVMFGPEPGQHLAALELSTGFMYDTEQACQAAAMNVQAKTQGIPISGAGFDCVKTKTT